MFFCRVEICVLYLCFLLFVCIFVIVLVFFCVVFFLWIFVCNCWLIVRRCVIFDVRALDFFRIVSIWDGSVWKFLWEKVVGLDLNGGGSGGGGGGEIFCGVLRVFIFIICFVLVFFDRDVVSTFSTRLVFFDVVWCVVDVLFLIFLCDCVLIFGDGYLCVDVVVVMCVMLFFLCGFASSRRGRGRGAVFCFCVCVFCFVCFVVVRVGVLYWLYGLVGLCVGVMNSF